MKMVLAGLICGIVTLPGGGVWTPWTPTDAGLPAVLPTNMNGINDDHFCKRTTGFCTAGVGQCHQQWTDTNGTGMFEKGDHVRCVDIGAGSW